MGVDRDALLRHLPSSSPVSDVFFSDANLDALQEGLRYLVYVRSDREFVIDRQDDTELQIIMRSVYLQYARNASADVLEQVRELNALVLDEATPRVLVLVRQHRTYQAQVAQLPAVMDHAKYVSSAGTKFLSMDRF